MEPLLRLKMRLKIADDSENELLKLLLDEAREDILTYTGRGDSQWIPAFDTTMIKLAVEKYGKLGMEGVKSRTEGDISTTFEASAMLKELDRYRLIKSSKFTKDSNSITIIDGGTFFDSDKPTRLIDGGIF